MYLLTIDGVCDKQLLKKVYTSIDWFNLSGRIFILYNCNVAKYKSIDKNIIAHAVVVDINQLETLTEDELENLLLDLIEMDLNIILTKYTGNNKDFIELFNNMSSCFQFKYKQLDQILLSDNIDLKNISVNDFAIINEIVNNEIIDFKFKASDFMIRLILKEDGNIYDDINGKRVLNLKKQEFVNISFYKPDYITDFIKQESELIEDKNVLSPYLYEPWFFVFNKDNLNKKVIEYKYRVFDTIKNLNPEDYPDLNSGVVELLNDGGYIRFNDILNIIKEND